VGKAFSRSGPGKGAWRQDSERQRLVVVRSFFAQTLSSCPGRIAGLVGADTYRFALGFSSTFLRLSLQSIRLRQCCWQRKIEVNAEKVVSFGRQANPKVGGRPKSRPMTVDVVTTIPRLLIKAASLRLQLGYISV
jgi:hypothetical protein